MDRIKCLVVDDEPLAQEIIERYIGELDTLELVAKCSHVIEAFSVLQKHPIDLLFLDIKMPVMNGVDFIRSLHHPPAVIFTTAFTEHAAESYNLDAVDYLVKPVTLIRFKKAIDKYLKQIDDGREEEKNYLYVKTGGRLVRIFHADILYAESLKDYLRIVTKSGNHITHQTMKSLQQILPADFIRVHRSFIINGSHIKFISKKEVKIGEVQIPVSESYRSAIKNLQ